MMHYLCTDFHTVWTVGQTLKILNLQLNINTQLFTGSYTAFEDVSILFIFVCLKHLLLCGFQNWDAKIIVFLP